MTVPRGLDDVRVSETAVFPDDVRSAGCENWQRARPMQLHVAATSASSLRRRDRRRRPSPTVGQSGYEIGCYFGPKTM